MTMLDPHLRAGLALPLLVALAACDRAAPSAAPAPVMPRSPEIQASAAVIESAAPPLASAPPAPAPVVPDPVIAQPPEPAKVERLAVPKDLPASLVRSLDGHAPVTVFLPGVCSNANAYLYSFPEAARDQGGIVAIDGDLPCQGAAGFRTFSWDAMKQHGRIEAALRAAGLTRLPKEGLTLIGYSQGATIAEQLAKAFPDRYTRIMLIGSPHAPSLPLLAEARAVVTSACSRDVTVRMQTAAKQIEAAGIPALYLQMPGCTHGNIAEGEKTFHAAFSFFAEKARAPRPSAEELALPE